MLIESKGGTCQSGIAFGVKVREDGIKSHRPRMPGGAAA